MLLFLAHRDIVYPMSWEPQAKKASKTYIVHLVIKPLMRWSHYSNGWKGLFSKIV